MTGGGAAGGVVHLDSASCSLMAPATVEACIAHLRREAEVGGRATSEAAPVFDRLRADLGLLLGMRGDQVALVHDATDGIGAAVASFRLGAGARVGVVRSEYGSNRMKLEHAGYRVVELATDDDGRLDVGSVPDGLDLVVISHIQSQLPVVQPVRDLTARLAGVPVVVDVAQSAGHVSVEGLGAAVVVGTSRKWLRGPRGAAFVAVADEWVDRLVPSPELGAATWSADDTPVPVPGAARFEVWEASMAARVGLAQAVADLLAAGPQHVFDRIAALGCAARARIDGLDGWHVVEPLDEPVGSVTFTHPTADLAAVHRRLQEQGILLSLIPPTRALTMDAPVLRASFHTFNTEADTDTLTTALSST
ncbi:MAG TPA: aminotransferase class V-fold PLP-dependent enzyme [Acidimicrobiales bacterium]